MWWWSRTYPNGLEEEYVARHNHIDPAPKWVVLSARLHA